MVMAMVRVFLLGIHFISNHLNCSSKEPFRRLLSIPSEVLLIADQTRKLVLQRPVGHLPDTPSAALETSVRYEHKQPFSASVKRGSFQICSTALKVLLSV